jgi:hypothetical protein
MEERIDAMDIESQKLIGLLKAAEAKDAPEAVDAIEESLLASGFYRRHKDPIVRIGVVAVDARPRALAERLLACAQENGPAYAVSALQSLFNVQEITTVTYAYVENIVTAETIDLGSDVLALPEEQAPNRHLADAINDIRGALSRRQGAILAASQTASPFLQAPPNEIGPSVFTKLGLKVPGEDRIQAALKMITLCGPSSPAIRAITTVVASSELRLFPVSGGVSFHYPGYLVNSGAARITTEVPILVQQYQTFSESDRRRIDTSISRLRLAVARAEPSEAIIDLAIALEAILSDKGNKEELTYRLRLRAALILESDLPARKQLQAFVNSLYKERSGVVHGGIPKSADIQLRKKGEQLVSRLIRKMLDLGRIPDWAVVELTAGNTLND